MILEFAHETDPRYVYFPVAPNEIRNTDLFDGYYGRLLTVCASNPDAIYDHDTETDTWRQRGVQR